LIVCGDERVTKRIDYPALEPSLWQLDGVVSRKKQLLPYLTSMLARLG
jgi:manganese-dependent inorganic pyrophosphatase